MDQKLIDGRRIFHKLFKILSIFVSSTELIFQVLSNYSYQVNYFAKNYWAESKNFR